MKKLLFVLLYGLTGITGLFGWELGRSVVSSRFGLYQPEFGTEGYAFLATIIACAMIAGFAARMAISKEKAEFKVLWRPVAFALLAWFPLSTVVMLPLHSVAAFVVVLLAVGFAFPLGDLAVVRWISEGV